MTKPRFAAVAREVVEKDIVDPLATIGITITAEEREAVLGVLTTTAGKSLEPPRRIVACARSTRRAVDAARGGSRATTESPVRISVSPTLLVLGIMAMYACGGELAPGATTSGGRSSATKGDGGFTGLADGAAAEPDAADSGPDTQSPEAAPTACVPANPGGRLPGGAPSVLAYHQPAGPFDCGRGGRFVLRSTWLEAETRPWKWSPRMGGQWQPLGGAGSESIAIDDVDVYMTAADQGLILACAKTGCFNSARTVVSGQFFLSGIAVDDANVYWTSSGSTNSVWKLPKTGGTPATLVTGVRATQPVLAAGQIFYVSQDTTQQTPPPLTVTSLSRAAPPSVVFAAPSTATSIASTATDGQAGVFHDRRWLRWRSRAPDVDGGSVLTLIPLGSQPYGPLASDGTYAYFGERDGSLVAASGLRGHGDHAGHERRRGHRHRAGPGCTTCTGEMPTAT